MTIQAALVEGSGRLTREVPGQTKNETPWLDAVVLLAHTLGCSKEKLIASYPDVLDHEAENKFFSLIQKRLQNTPVSYLTGKKEFYGLPFYVDERVLVPRPDTEILVEETLNTAASLAAPVKILDLCTGSGCVGITLVHENPRLLVSAADVSPLIIPVFEKNCRELLGRVLPFYLSDLLTNVPGKFNIIAANPPYLTSGETEAIMKTRWPEPALALDGGADGLNLIRALSKQAMDSLEKDGYLLIEADSRQMDSINNILTEDEYQNIQIIPDLAGRARVIKGRKTQ